MRKLSLLLVALTLASSANAAVPTAESIERLLAVTKAERLVDNVMANIDSMMKQSMAASLNGRTPTPEQQRAFDSLQPKLAQIFREEMTWAKFEPLYIQIYQESFTQEEVDALTAFYSTPVGMAYVDKLPAVLRKSLTATQSMMGPMMQRVQELVRETSREAQAAKPAAGRP